MSITTIDPIKTYSLNELDGVLRKLTTLEEQFRNNPILTVNEQDYKRQKEFEETYYSHQEKYESIKTSNTNFSLHSNANYFLSSNLDSDFSVNQQMRFLYSPSHRHSFIEMVYIYDGEYKQYLGLEKDELIMKKGEICILNSNLVHAVSPPGENDIIINCIMPKEFFDSTLLKLISSNDIITEFLINSIFEEKEKSDYILFPSSDNDKVASIMELIISESLSTDSYSSVVTKSYVVALFTELLRVYREKIGNDYPKDVIDKTIRKVLDYIQLNLKDINLSDAARHFHFNPNYLGRLIKQKTNRNFSDIVQDERLNKACILLENSNLSVKDISEEVGYHNPNQFYKVFKEKYRSTPYEYRKINNEKRL